MSNQSDPSPAGEWDRQFTGDASRVGEWIALYESLGREVAVRSLEPDDVGPECVACVVVDCDACVVLFTRKSEIS